jgi:alpha 1,2-mannosyltransferase
VLFLVLSSCGTSLELLPLTRQRLFAGDMVSKHSFYSYQPITLSLASHSPRRISATISPTWFIGKRHLRFAAFVFFLLPMVALLSYETTSNVILPLRGQLSGVLSEDSTSQSNDQIWQTLVTAFRDNKPAIKPIQLKYNLDLNLPHEGEEVPDLATMTTAEVDTMRRAHTQFVESVKSQPIKLAYKAGTKGIATTASAESLPVVVISLRMIRQTRSTLPVEVFVSDVEVSQSDICSKIISSLGGQCIPLSPILGNETAPEYRENKYFNKLLAMLFSSFEDLLFLDADNLAVVDPSPFFTDAPFTETGMVVWPDYWSPTASRKFYKVISSNDSILHGTAESGQLLISKRTHTRSLLLAAFYNFYGREYYYPLLTQGGPGSGDKDTFVPAAVVMGEPYHYVSEGAGGVGHFIGGEWRGRGMIQHNPIMDYARIKSGPMAQSSATAAFVHANVPKLNPWTVFDRSHPDSPTNDPQGKNWRMWGEPEEALLRKFNGVDMEERLWKEICGLGCDKQVIEMLKPREDVCSKCNEYTLEIFGWQTNKH